MPRSPQFACAHSTVARAHAQRRAPFVFAPFVFAPFVFAPFVFAPFVFAPFVFAPFVFAPFVFARARARCRTRP